MRRLIAVATERRVTIVMFTVAIVLFGMVSLSRLKVNLLPDISYPTITVRTELTGAAPIDELAALLDREALPCTRLSEAVANGATLLGGASGDPGVCWLLQDDGTPGEADPARIVLLAPDFPRPCFGVRADGRCSCD